MQVYIIALFILLCIIYLSGFFDSYIKLDKSYKIDNDLLLIEFLTQHKTKTKNYRRIPEGFSSYNKSLVGKKINDKAIFRYEYPLFHNEIGVFEITLYPNDVSQQVDFYGVQNYLIEKTGDGYTLNTSNSESDFVTNMNKDGWYFNSFSDAGIDYKYLVLKYADFSNLIAQQIFSDLAKNGNDSYFNRVQAALNFVQFIPYGCPNLDTNDWYYHELGVPPETLIMGDGDGDSKSVFFASILVNLIPIQNIVLVTCLVKSQNDKTNGAHMMAAVSNLGISGESVIFENNEYLLLETTQPTVIGAFDWNSFKATSIIGLT
jgi:hypothetical protein